MAPSILETSLKGKEKAFLSTYLSTEKLAVVTDPPTWEALGKRVFDALGATGLRHIAFEAPPRATLQDAEILESRAAGCEALIAIGSGTINDLCKYAAHQLEIPYVVFPTAPSMNGYVSATASLVDGLPRTKQSFPATPPLAVFCDLEVLAAAPKRLILSGLGDSLCRPTAQADWLLSHLLLETPYDERPFELLKPYEKKLFDSSDKLTSGNLEVIELLMRTLLASGEGMRLAGGSYPASQGEHMIAHTMETLAPDIAHKTYHGEQIGVTTLTVARLQERILASEKAPTVHMPDSSPLEGEQTSGLSAEALAKAEASRGGYQSNDPSPHEISAAPIGALKFPLPLKGGANARVETLNQRLAKNWTQWREQIKAVTLPASYLEDVLRRAGAPTTPHALGWSEEHYNEAIRLAPSTRDRFTFLDLN